MENIIMKPITICVNDGAGGGLMMAGTEFIEENNYNCVVYNNKLSNKGAGGVNLGAGERPMQHGVYIYTWSFT